MNTISEPAFIALSVVLYTILIAIVVRIDRNQKHPVIVGLLYALLALSMDAACLRHYDFAWIPSYRAIPLLAAGIFSAPLTALVAGGVTVIGVAAEYVYMHLFQSGPDLWHWLVLIGTLETCSPLLIVGYALVVKRFVLDRQQPNFIQAGALGLFGEIVHVGSIFLIIGVFTRLGEAMGITTELEYDGRTIGISSLGLEFFYSFYPDSFLAAIGMLAAADWFAGKRGTWRNELASPFTLGVFLFGAIAIFVARYAEYLAFQATEKQLITARKQLTVQIEDQIGYMLHRNAISLRDSMVIPQRFRLPEMQKFAETFDVDEINIFSRERELLASNLESEINYRKNGVPAGELRDFFELCSGQHKFVKNPFRASLSDADFFVKYIGVPFKDGNAFLQMGYSWPHFLEEVADYFFPMFDTARIGTNGYFIVTDSNGEIVAPVAGHPEALGKQLTRDCGMTVEEWDAPDGVTFEANLFGVWVMCRRGDGLDRYRVYAVLPDTEYFTPYMRLAAIILFVLFIVVFTFRVLMLRAAHIQAKLDAVRKSDMLLAATIQNSELRKDVLDLASCRIQATMTPAKEVGGDFYDYQELGSGIVAVAIADVSGKGVPAAFVMMKAHSVLESSIFTCNSLQEAVQSANETLHQGNESCMFVTAWIGLFDPADGTLEYVSAGHNPPLVKRADGSVEWVKTKRRFKPLALFADSKYETQTLQLHPGDTILLYTDGVTEAMNPSGELYGEKRLEGALAQSAGNPIAAVTGNLNQFTGQAPQADDITMLILEVKKS